ncbi:Cephalosporin-C deacetylase [Streptomyces sp. YIM 130001]|uniref:acetylxylan esterase n=1 Tax=Streptomyces sp. YIM 130001 TaxID=2259644 RepID=UPI000E657336|nr:acetylxylan esterase [Streptomyces sp. YIM 130001]RII15881.1 Cephalosporin-C deacetylase [Streptomyces sp. YIM 130001]
MPSHVSFPHEFPFDPAHGYTEDDLAKVGAPPPPDGFAEFWRSKYEAARAVATDPVLGEVEEERDGLRIHGVTYTSVDGVRLGGWLALPTTGPVEHGFVVSHGYGGRDTPGPDLPVLDHSAALLPCVRGMETRGLQPGIPSVASEHVLHGIESRDTYVIGDCVADLWCAASALLELVPSAGPHLGLFGDSFGGGLGALALPWDERFAAAQFTVPTFGNHPLRLTLQCTGSGEAVRAYHRTHPQVTDVLAYFDAATAATLIDVPTMTAPAAFDPSVPPPGQYAVHNALRGERALFPLRAGHFEYDGTDREKDALRRARRSFFARHLG